MKVCLSCDHRFEGASWQCPRCHQAPAQDQGIFLFAPYQSAGNGGFKAEYFRQLADLEANHFWFRNRNRLLLWALDACFPRWQSFMEVGCGTGFALSGISKRFPNRELSGSELFLEGLLHARGRLPDLPLHQMDAARIPFEEEFDVMGAFDVLEHVAEDEAVLRQLHRAIRPGGGLLLTVPQHPWLWSIADARACHQRRYTRADLARKVEAAGFKIRRVTSFVTLLMPLMWISRRRQDRTGDSAGKTEFQLSRALGGVLEAILGMEAGLIRAGMNLPAGGSLLMVAERGAR
jgi:SAM-dependent methyltransferase